MQLPALRRPARKDGWVDELQWRLGWARLHARMGISLIRNSEADWHRELPLDPWPGDVEAGRRIIHQQFQFLDKSVAYDGEFWERCLEQNTPWQKALHGFAWLRDVIAYNESKLSASQIREFIWEWWKSAARRGGVARNADITAERVSYFIAYHEFLTRGASDGFKRALLRDELASLKRLESIRRRKGGRSSLAVLKALIYGGMAIPTAGFLLHPALGSLRRALRLRFLGDGGHLSRSPGWHLEEIKTCMEIRATLTARGLKDHHYLDEAIARYLDAMMTMTHGDLKLACFNDTIEEPVRDVLGLWSSWKKPPPHPQTQLPEMRFARLEQGGSIAIIDVGPPVARLSRSFYGTLSFEFSHGGQRLIVNCGGFRGGKSAWRRACKATAAHSTLALDDTSSWQPIEQAAYPTYQSPDVEFALTAPDESEQLEATYDGYVSYAGLLHRRTLILNTDGSQLVGTDIVMPHPSVSRREPHRAYVRFHLHPSVVIGKTTRGAVELETPGGQQWRFETDRQYAVAVEDSIYLGEGGIPQKTQQIAIESLVSGSEDLKIGWTLSRQPAPDAA